MTGVNKSVVIIISLGAFIQMVGSLSMSNQCIQSCTNWCNKFEGDFLLVSNQLMADNLTTCWEVDNKNEADIKTESEVTSVIPEVFGDRSVFEMEFSPQKKRSLIILQSNNCLRS